MDNKYKLLHEYKITHLSKNTPGKILAQYDTDKRHANRCKELDQRYWKVEKLEKSYWSEYIKIF